ncbi:MAG: ABC transporter permease [Chloroflexota bacterium]
MLRRIWALTTKEFIHMRNDWWLPAFMLFGGVLELMLVGWATSRPITNLPLMVLDMDQSATSRQVVTAFENTGTFMIEEYVSDFEQIESALQDGKITAAVIFPKGFEAELLANGGEPILPVLINGAESIPGREAQGSIEGVIRSLGEQVVIEQIGINPEQFAGFDLSLRVWYNQSLSEAYYSLPAELALMLEFTVLLFAALAFSREKELGTLEQLLVMPFSSLEIIIGKAIPVMIVGFVDFVLMLSMTVLFFKVPIRGSLALLLVLAIGYLLVELGKGMVISVIARTQHQAFLIVMLIGMADFMFTGYAAPVEAMPQLLQWFAKLVPAHHWLAIVRGIMLKGVGLEVLWPNLLALFILGTVIITFSLRYVRRALN